MQFPNLTPILGPVLWAAVGAVATRLYMPERTTQVLDVAVRVEDAEAARQRLSEGGFTYQGEMSIGGSSWLSPYGMTVDVVEMSEPWLTEALIEAQ